MFLGDERAKTSNETISDSQNKLVLPWRSSYFGSWQCSVLQASLQNVLSRNTFQRLSLHKFSSTPTIAERNFLQKGMCSPLKASKDVKAIQKGLVIISRGRGVSLHEARTTIFALTWPTPLLLNPRKGKRETQRNSPELHPSAESII